jgi:AraC family transcriptional regulator
MLEMGAYGQRLAECLHIDSSRFILSRSLGKSEVGFTETRSEHPIHGLSDPIPREDAFLVTIQLRDFPDHKYWIDGRQVPVFSLRAGCAAIHDLKRDPVFLMDKPFHSVHFYIPRKFLDAIADEFAAARIGDLRYEPGNAVDDPIVRALTSVLYPALDRPGQANRMFVDCVMLALGCHVAQTYGDLRSATYPARGGLAPWQERRAKEIMEANLAGDIPLAELARECGLSTSHFARAFKESTGTSPHRWLMRRRIDSAMRLLRNRQSSLSQVALACGFSDQSHFTRVFTRFSGTGPAAWRRLHQEDVLNIGVPNTPTFHQTIMDCQKIAKCDVSASSNSVRA